MKIIEAKMAQDNEKLFVCLDIVLHSEVEIARLDEAQLRELIVYLKKNRPELICPIMCDDCAENNAQESYSNYCINKSERGK